MDLNCGNSESTFNFPVSAVTYICALTSHINETYKQLPFISEEIIVSSPVPTPSIEIAEQNRLSTKHNPPVNLDLFLTATPSGTVAPTPTPTVRVKQKYLINFKLVFFTEILLKINLKEKYIMLQHSKEGRLPNSPILLSTYFYVNNILNNSSAVIEWNIPWKSSLVNQSSVNSTLTPYPVESNIYKYQNSYKDINIVANAPIQWSDMHFIYTGHQMFLTNFVSIYIINKPPYIPSTKDFMQILEAPSLGNNYTATIRVIDNNILAKDTDNMWDFTVAFHN